MNAIKEDVSLAVLRAIGATRPHARRDRGRRAAGAEARASIEVTGSNIKRIEGETALPVDGDHARAARSRGHPDGDGGDRATELQLVDRWRQHAGLDRRHRRRLRQRFAARPRWHAHARAA